MKWADGREYDGEWSESNKHGEGKYRKPDGHSYEGSYKYDLKNGYGVFIFPNGTYHRGNWRDGKPHGEGYVLRNGVEKQGIWSKGTFIRWTK